ncbi:unnamed protein product [Caenorhabditis brenneri]
MLVIYDKSLEFGIGVFEWWVRLDRPHSGVDFYHLNVNPRITGHPDPHTHIPYPIALTIQFTGSGLRLLNKAAPFVFAAFIIDDYKLIYDEMEENRAEAAKDAAFTILKYVFCWYGARSGAYLASFILPGVGSLLGALGGGAVGRFVFERLLTHWT